MNFVDRGMAVVFPGLSIMSATLLRACAAVWILVASMQPAHGSPPGCADLSGHYGFFGTWEHRSFDGGKPESIAAYTASNPEPRLDRFALGIQAWVVTNPQVAILRQDPATGFVELDVTGGPPQPRTEASAAELPVSVPLACNGTEWIRERATSSGGENTPSKEREQIVLRVESNGDLVVKGHLDTTIGWILKKKISSNWQARFQRASEHPEER